MNRESRKKINYEASSNVIFPDLLPRHANNPFIEIAGIKVDKEV